MALLLLSLLLFSYFFKRGIGGVARVYSKVSSIVIIGVKVNYLSFRQLLNKYDRNTAGFKTNIRNVVAVVGVKDVSLASKVEGHS